MNKSGLSIGSISPSIDRTNDLRPDKMPEIGFRCNSSSLLFSKGITVKVETLSTNSAAIPLS